MRTWLLSISLAVATALAATACTAPAFAADTGPFVLTIKDHVFVPAELEVPAGQKFELRVINQDKTAEEFESKDLHREKVIPGGGSILLTLGPLKPGSYEFYGEFNPKTARGKIVAR